jgi:hypothetical protein
MGFAFDDWIYSHRRLQFLLIIINYSAIANLPTSQIVPVLFCTLLSLYWLLNSQLFLEPRCMPLYSHSLNSVGLPVPILSNPTAHSSRYIAAARTT